MTCLFEWYASVVRASPARARESARSAVLRAVFRRHSSLRRTGYDVWFPNLAPSVETMKRGQDANVARAVGGLREEGQGRDDCSRSQTCPDTSGRAVAHDELLCGLLLRERESLSPVGLAAAPHRERRNDRVAMLARSHPFSVPRDRHWPERPGRCRRCATRSATRSGRSIEARWRCGGSRLPRRRDRLVRRRYREQATHQRQLLFVRRQRRELPRDQKFAVPPNSRLLVFAAGRRPSPGPARVAPAPAPALPWRGFLRGHMLIGMGHAPEQIGKGREEARPFRLEVIERVERLAERREFIFFVGRLHPQPGANRLQRHVSRLSQPPGRHRDE